MYAHRSTHGPVDLAFTDRYGGVSVAPFDSLNLAITGEDDEAARRENLQLVLDDFAPGDELADIRQVHGGEIDVVERRRTSQRPAADGVVTARAGVVLAVRAADCVPVLLAAPGADGPVIGVAHAGRNGVLAEVVGALVAAMRALGADITAGQAHVGPAVCGRCYEVPAELQTEVVAAVPAAASTTRDGTPGLDLPRAVLHQLAAAGVRDIAHDETCTIETPALFSHRRDGVTGRFAGVVWLPA